MKQGRLSPNSNLLKPSQFFEDQLTAIDLWASQRNHKSIPHALPCLLQALLSQSMRERALWTLARYMDLGPAAVASAMVRRESKEVIYYFFFKKKKTL